MSLLYGVAASVTQSLYVLGILPVYQASKPVISIGNITVGGTGKTPLVTAVVRILMGRGLRVAILTRGYMPRSSKEFSDEARMLEEHLPGVPVFANRNRRVSIEECLKHHAVDVFVCDDAYQHSPLKRDLDIVAVDAANPFGNGELLPRGILREGKGALRRAGIIVMTKTDGVHAKGERLFAELESIAPQALIVQSQHVGIGYVDVYGKTTQDLSHLKGVSVVAFCAIADPNSFRKTLSEAGLNIVNLFVFMDHHVYTLEDMTTIRRFAIEHDVGIILTTHKDAVKIDRFGEFWQGFRVHYMQLELEITKGKNAFIERILSVVRH